jgi:glucan phosphoethanolaminetransferase (alkaline phosphatase superfamily)
MVTLTEAQRPSESSISMNWQIPVMLKIVLVIVLLIITNLTFFQGLPFEKLFRLLGLVAADPQVVDTVGEQAKTQGGGQLKALLEKLLPLIPIWIATFAGVAYAALDKRLWVRFGAAVLVAGSTGFTTLYEKVAEAPLTFLDIVTMWNARHEAGRAIEQYQVAVLLGAVFAIVSLIVILWPARQTRLSRSRLWRRLWIIPLLPVAVHAGVYYQNSGFYPFALPGQYNSAALGSLLAYQLNTQEVPARQPVAWAPIAGNGVKHIVVMVDESIRGDFIDLTPGNQATPHLAALSQQLLDFGPATSGGVCSNYSNALIRFGASRKDVVGSANTNATLFAYAKKAGYRTVYIDAQAYHIAVGHKIQNFMTVQEKSEIDGFYAIDTPDLPQADYELTKIIAKELKSDQPVFIYANKNGAHFPYDSTYPAGEAVFQPTQSEAGDTLAARINSYRNAISWSVDRWMKDFFEKVDLSNTVMIYTGDHGQRFEPGRLTHCQTTDVDPKTGLVPMLIHAPEGIVRDTLAKALALSKGRASHFQIAPTVYQLMGYRDADIVQRYDESFFAGTTRPAEFTVGDIFGLFGTPIVFQQIDLKQNYLEAKVQ